MFFFLFWLLKSYFFQRFTFIWRSLQLFFQIIKIPLTLLYADFSFLKSYGNIFHIVFRTTIYAKIFWCSNRKIADKSCPIIFVFDVFVILATIIFFHVFIFNIFACNFLKTFLQDEKSFVRFIFTFRRKPCRPCLQLVIFNDFVFSEFLWIFGYTMQKLLFWPTKSTFGGRRWQTFRFLYRNQFLIPVWYSHLFFLHIFNFRFWLINICLGFEIENEGVFCNWIFYFQVFEIGVVTVLRLNVAIGGIIFYLKRVQICRIQFPVYGIWHIWWRIR